jgi:hypothetical protein
VRSSRLLYIASACSSFAGTFHAGAANSVKPALGCEAHGVGRSPPRAEPGRVHLKAAPWCSHGHRARRKALWHLNTKVQSTLVYSRLR